MSRLYQIHSAYDYGSGFHEKGAFGGRLFLHEHRVIEGEVSQSCSLSSEYIIGVMSMEEKGGIAFLKFTSRKDEVPQYTVGWYDWTFDSLWGLKNGSFELCVGHSEVSVAPCVQDQNAINILNGKLEALRTTIHPAAISLATSLLSGDNRLEIANRILSSISKTEKKNFMVGNPKTKVLSIFSDFEVCI